MAAKLFFQLHQQRGKRDCGVATLATLLGRTYEEVLIVAAMLSPNVLKKGLYATDLHRIADSLGSTLKRRVGSMDLEEKTGILEVKFKSKREHFVFLVNGLVFDLEDPLQAWDVSTYLKHHKAVVQGLNEEEESE